MILDLRFKALGICTLLFLASFWRAGSVAHAQDPTPVPTPTQFPAPVYIKPPTHTLIYTQPAFVDELEELGSPITFTHSEGLTSTLDVGLWEYENFKLVVQIGNTVIHLGNQYHVFDILFAFALAGLVIGPIVQIIRSRGGGGGGAGTTTVVSDS